MINKILMTSFLILSLPTDACDFTKERAERSTERYAICAGKVHVFHQACVIKLFKNEDTTTLATACKHDSLRMSLGHMYRSEFARHVCALCKKASPARINKFMTNKITLIILLFSNTLLFNSDFSKPTIYAICGENEHVFHARCVVSFYGFFGHIKDPKVVCMGTNCLHDPKKIVVGYQKPLAGPNYCAICKKELHFKD